MEWGRDREARAVPTGNRGGGERERGVDSKVGRRRGWRINR